MSHSPPSTLGKYQIIREIARSNDIVYEAYDPVMNRRVALKELAVPHGSTEQQRGERLKRFLREAKAAGSLAHPNVVTIFEVGEEAGRHFLAMEYLDGHTLRNELDTHGFLDPKRACEIALAVLGALEYSHQNGVIHRDIKPENIQLLTDGRVKLTDFGIARLTFEPNLTMDGQVFGTPSYMSPEQVVGREIDARSDLFSVGVILYEMLCGQKPFQGDSVVTITYSILNKEPDRQSQINFALWQVLGKALDKSPGLRYSSAKEMSEAIEAALTASLAGPVLDPPQASNPTVTPYGTNPYLYASTPPPPPVYPYNPYQGQPAQAPQQQPPFQPPFNIANLPVYYPPPPRRPLFTPAVKIALFRIIATIVVMASGFALVIVLLQSVFGRAEEIASNLPDRGPYVNAATPNSVPQEDSSQFEPNAEAAQYAERGRQRLVEAESEESDAARKMLYGEAATDLGTAYRLESDPFLRGGYGDDAARALLKLGQMAMAKGQRAEARRFLGEARGFVSPRSRLEAEVVRELDKVS